MLWLISHFQACPPPPPQTGICQAFVILLVPCRGEFVRKPVPGVRQLSMFITIPPCISWGLTSFYDLYNNRECLCYELLCQAYL